MARLSRNILLIFSVLALSASVVFAAEEFAITTYYPSPYGSYNSLFTDKLGVGDNNSDGNLTAADVPTNPGEVWIKGNVGIGTTNPGAKLEIAGLVYQSGLGRSTYFGYEAGRVDDLTNNFNTGVGYQALRSNTTGGFNTANGAGALRSNTGGINNTANGGWALQSNTTGNSSTANGVYALYFNTTGNNNTAVGYKAFWTGAAYSNSTALGYDAQPTASNQVRIGNASVTSIGGYAAWSNLSDGRFKKDVKENVPGLAFITKLRPVTFYWDMDKLEAFLKTPDDLRLKDGEEQKAKILQTGFVAQEVEKASQEIGYDFNGVLKPQNENDYYSLRYAEFVVPLVEAVQELNAKIEEQKKEIESLKKTMAKTKEDGSR